MSGRSGLGARKRNLQEQEEALGRKDVLGLLDSG